jgi:putative transposase
MMDHQNEYPIGKMAEVLNVSRSGYYKYLRRGETKQYRENKLLSEKIRDIFQMSRKTYGSPRITDELHDMGYRCSKNRVWRIMRELQLVSCRHKRFKVRTTDSNHALPVSPNLLGRNFTVSKPDKVWVSDITYITTSEGWLFLCIILDLFSRKIVGWSMKDHMRTSLIIDALDMAYKSRQPGEGLIFHSDRGSQYASKDFRDKLAEYKMVSSMSRKGNCWDNACAESVFGTIKTELVYLNDYASREWARSDIFEYIEVFYNRLRRHSTLGGLSPVKYELKKCA